MSEKEKLNQLISELEIPGLNITDENSTYSGANHSIIKLTSNGRYYAMKIFKSDEKFVRELFFLKHCRNRNINNVPRLEKANKENKRWILMEWIEGEMLKTINNSYIKEIAGFIGAINNGLDIKAIKAPEATENIIDSSSLIYQLKARQENIQNIIAHQKTSEFFNNWAKNELHKITNERIDRLKRKYKTVTGAVAQSTE